MSRGLNPLSIEMPKMNELIDKLLDYFNLNDNEWPVMSVWHNGTFIKGVVSDELYSLLSDIKEMRESDNE